MGQEQKLRPLTGQPVGKPYWAIKPNKIKAKYGNSFLWAWQLNFDACAWPLRVFPRRTWRDFYFYDKQTL